MTNYLQAKRTTPIPFPVAVKSCVFPAAWTPAIEAAAREHARAEMPNEAAGIVEGGAYVALANVSPNPETEVMVSDEDRIRICNADVFFHSHPDGPACPSKEDMQFQMDIEKPCVIFAISTNDIFAWGDMLARPPIVGRAFRHGVFDCYSTVRDWYKENRDIVLRDGPRGWDWWQKGEDIYENEFALAGFRKIDVSEATQIGDALLFRFTFKVVMHAALVTSPDLLLHHASGRFPFDTSRLACEVPRLRYARLAAYGLRYDP